MKLCSRAKSIKKDFQKATESFRSQELAALAAGDDGRAKGMHAQGLGSRRAMAIRLNGHIEHCKECG